MSRPFCNNLKKGDRVLVAGTDKRVGTVARNPGESKRLTHVLFTGYERAKGIDVMDLRFIPPGSDAAEDVPPIDGEPPANPLKTVWEQPRISGPAAVVEESFVDQLRRKVEAGNAEIEAMNARAREIRAENDRLERAIAALEGKP